MNIFMHVLSSFNCFKASWENSFRRRRVDVVYITQPSMWPYCDGNWLFVSVGLGSPCRFTPWPESTRVRRGKTWTGWPAEMSESRLFWAPALTLLTLSAVCFIGSKDGAWMCVCVFVGVNKNLGAVVNSQQCQTCSEQGVSFGQQ